MMNKQEQLSLAISIAAQAHNNQYDRGGKPYILHPLHIMSQLLFDTQLATIAVLHDVVEDTSWTTNSLHKNGMSYRVVHALDLLTHDPEDSYEQYIDKICTNYDAIRVKRKDLEHNSDISRLKSVGKKDLDRRLKYSKAFVKLGEARKEFV